MVLEPSHRPPDAAGRRVADLTSAPERRGRGRSRSRPWRGLRLVGQDQTGRESESARNRSQAVGVPITDAADPRWVLAVRAAEALDGALLEPQKRDRLMRLGRVLGLTPFDSSLVIAVVQDQARRGHCPHECPQAGSAQLSMISTRDPRTWARHHRAVHTAWLVTVLIGLEALIIWWLF